MLKAIALLKRKNGMSHDDFVEYYENKHAVLIRKLLPNIVDYRRNFVEHETAFVNAAVAPIDFDVVTEIFFANRADYDAFLAKAAEAEIAQAIADDEENLFDRSATRMFVVDQPSRT